MTATRKRLKKEAAIEARVSDIQDDFLTCRDYGHFWRPASVREVEEARRPGFGTLRLSVCKTCGTERRELINVRGEVGQRSYAHPTGYLLGGLNKELGVKGRLDKRFYRAEWLARHAKEFNGDK